jgi:hypothetical protein
MIRKGSVGSFSYFFVPCSSLQKIRTMLGSPGYRNFGELWIIVCGCARVNSSPLDVGLRFFLTFTRSVVQTIGDEAADCHSGALFLRRGL